MRNTALPVQIDRSGQLEKNPPDQAKLKRLADEVHRVAEDLKSLALFR